MTIKIEREKAIQAAYTASHGYHSKQLVETLAALGLIEFVEPKSAEEVARYAMLGSDWASGVDHVMDELRAAGIGFTFTGESTRASQHGGEDAGK